MKGLRVGKVDDLPHRALLSFSPHSRCSAHCSRC